MNELSPIAAFPGSTRLLLDQCAVVGEVRTGSRRFWTGPELRIIRAHFPTGGINACLPLLPGRTAGSIYQRAAELGVKRLDGGGRPRERQTYPPSASLDAAIERVYREGPDLDALKQLSRATGRPRVWFTNRAAVLGLVTPRFKQLPWSQAERELVSTMRGKHPQTIRQALRKAGFARTTTAVVMELKRMGWRREKADGHYSAATLCQCFGVSADTLRRWDRLGLEVAREKSMRASPHAKPHDKAEWCVTERALRAFVIDNVAIIDFRKVDKFWLVDLLAASERAVSARAATKDRSRRL